MPVLHLCLAQALVTWMDVFLSFISWRFGGRGLEKVRRLKRLMRLKGRRMQREFGRRKHLSPVSQSPADKSVWLSRHCRFCKLCIIRFVSRFESGQLVTRASAILQATTAEGSSQLSINTESAIFFRHDLGSCRFCPKHSYPSRLDPPCIRHQHRPNQNCPISSKTIFRRLKL